MVDAVEPFEPCQSLDAGKVKCRSIVFVFGKHRDPVGEVVPDSRQRVEARDEVRMGRERAVRNIHPIDAQPHAGIRLKPTKFSGILKRKPFRHLLQVQLLFLARKLRPRDRVNRQRRHAHMASRCTPLLLDMRSRVVQLGFHAKPVQ